MTKRTVTLTESELKNMINESVHRVLTEERYMSDEDIAAQYGDMKIVDFVLERSGRFDGWTGRFKVEYPNADDVDFDSSVVNNFIVYDMDGNRIAWDNWMPEEATQYLEDIIRKEIAKRKGGVVESKLNEIGDTPEGQRKLGALHARKVYGGDPNAKDVHDFAQERAGGWEPDGKGKMDNPLYYDYAQGYIDYGNAHPDEAMADWVAESVTRKLNEIGDTSRGQYMLGRLDARNILDKNANPDGKHATYKGDAFDAAAKGEDGVTDAFYWGASDERGGNKRDVKCTYGTMAMNDRDKLGEKFVNFFSRNDKMLELISDYENEGKDAFGELMDAFEEKLGYTLTDKSRSACKKAYNMWWYYNGQDILRGMEESRVQKITDSIVESLKRMINERRGGSKVEKGHTDISDKVFNALYVKFHGDETMESYMEEISDIPMEINATIEDISDPESGYRAHEIDNVKGGDEIMAAIKSKGLPEDIARVFCDTVAEVIANLDHDDFEKEELEPETLGESVKRLLKEMIYGEEYHNLAEFIDKKHKEWLDDGFGEERWNEEGIIWTVQEYFGSTGEFTEEDWQTLKAMDLLEVGAACEEDFAEASKSDEM